MGYAVRLKRSAVKTLEKLPQDVQRRVRLRIDGLPADPRPTGVKKLAGDPNLWRIRVGNYRLVYEIHDRRRLVVVLRIAHRREVYRDI